MLNVFTYRVGYVFGKLEIEDLYHNSVTSHAPVQMSIEYAFVVIRLFCFDSIK